MHAKLNPITRLRNVGRMAAGPVRDRGLRQTMRSIQLVWTARRQEKLEGFDARFGTDTARSFHFADLEASGPDIPSLWRYAPVLRINFDKVMRALGLRYQDFAFVDLGSGKGRAVLLASDWPFRRVIGVELAPTLHAVAENNLRVYRSPTQRCAKVELVCSDAAEWAPPDDNLLVYLFQPFPEDVFARVMANLEASLERKPRPLVVTYLNPVFEEAVLRPGWLRTVQKAEPTKEDRYGWAIYANDLATNEARFSGVESPSA